MCKTPPCPVFAPVWSCIVCVCFFLLTQLAVGCLPIFQESLLLWISFVMLMPCCPVCIHPDWSSVLMAPSFIPCGSQVSLPAGTAYFTLTWEILSRIFWFPCNPINPLWLFCLIPSNLQGIGLVCRFPACLKRISGYLSSSSVFHQVQSSTPALFWFIPPE